MLCFTFLKRPQNTSLHFNYWTIRCKSIFITKPQYWPSKSRIDFQSSSSNEKQRRKSFLERIKNFEGTWMKEKRTNKIFFPWGEFLQNCSDMFLPDFAYFVPLYRAYVRTSEKTSRIWWLNSGWNTGRMWNALGTKSRFHPTYGIVSMSLILSMFGTAM